MIGRIFVYVEHHGGVADESALELATAACKIAGQAPVTAVLTGWGAGLDAVSASLASTFTGVWKLAHPALAYPNAELVRKALVSVLPRGSLCLLAHSHFGIDLAPGLSIKLQAACVADVIDIAGLDATNLKVVRQEFGGQVNAHVDCDISAGAVVTMRPGCFKPFIGVTAAGQIIDKSSQLGDLAARRRYVETITAEAGDVDITKHSVLVSVGRGFQDKVNLPLAEDLADAMGAAVSCSRPVVDAKWLPKSRQVGSSGQTVRPKVYLACGISGSFQHLAGLKGNPFIVAINKNPKAPIFQVASVGIVDDVLGFLPSLTEKIRAVKGQKQTAA